MICKTCKYFDQSEHDAPHLGWCNFKFPVWFYKLVQASEYDVNITVRVDDYCSMYAKEN